MNILTAIKMRNPNATRKELFKLGIWTTADGKRIHKSKIDDRHLINIASYLLKAAEAEAAKLTRFYLTTPGPRGEMAQDAFDRELDYWCFNGEGPDPVHYLLESHPFYSHVEGELKKRGLLGKEHEPVLD